MNESIKGWIYYCGGFLLFLFGIFFAFGLNLLLGIICVIVGCILLTYGKSRTRKKIIRIENTDKGQ